MNGSKPAFVRRESSRVYAEPYDRPELNDSNPFKPYKEDVERFRELWERMDERHDDWEVLQADLFRVLLDVYEEVMGPYA